MAGDKAHIPRILVIKLGALGDFIQAMGSFKAVRDFHDRAEITLLTTAPFESLALECGYFDAVWADSRPPLWKPQRWLALRRRLRAPGFSRVYDLQTSDRSSFYFRLFFPGPVPEWSGIARGCSHRHVNPRRDFMHTIERQAEQLALAGISKTPLPDLSWMKADVSRFSLDPPYVLLVPGGAAHRPGKRWPVNFYGELARRLVRNGVRPVLLGTKSESELAAHINAGCPQALDLTGETSLEEVGVLARGALDGVGNDTGSMHLIAAANGPTLVLFSRESDPALCAPRGTMVRTLRCDDLSTLPVEEVQAAMMAPAA